MEKLLLNVAGFQQNSVGRLLSNDVFLGGFALLFIGGLVAYFRSFLYYLRDYLYTRVIVKIHIKSTDPCFNWILEWLAVNQVAKESKTLTAHTTYGKIIGTTYRTQQQNNRPTLKYVPAPGNHVFLYKNKYIWLTRSVHSDSQSALSGNTPDRETITLSCFGSSTDILKSFCAEAMNRALDEEEGTVAIFVAEHYQWRKALAKPKRPFSSVILDGDLSDSIANDVNEFMNSKKWYEDRGLPHRRGYLFYGPPGCGKTSYLIALASKLDLNVCCLSLNEGTLTDAALNSILRQVPPKSLVLIEDVDCVFTERTATDEKKNTVTFSGLLNAIDGVAANEGRMLFLTTNHKEKLSPALIRPGRVDVQVYFGLASKSQIKRMWETFYPNQTEKVTGEFVSRVPENSYSMSKLQGFFLNHKDKPLEALAALDELLNAPLEDPDTHIKSASNTATAKKNETQSKRKAEKTEKKEDVAQNSNGAQSANDGVENTNGEVQASQPVQRKKTGLRASATGITVPSSVPVEVFAIDSLSGGESREEKRFMVRKLSSTVG